jgi:hypothetical protein
MLTQDAIDHGGTQIYKIDADELHRIATLCYQASR